MVQADISPVAVDPMPRSPGRGFATVLSVFALLVLALLALGSDARGVRARTLDEGVVRVSSAGALLATASGLHAHGVDLLAATADLGYAPVGISDLSRATAWPVADIDLAGVIRSRAGRESWSWALARLGVARRIDYLMPSGEFKQRVAEGVERGFPGISADRRSIQADDVGYVRLIADRVLHTGEPLLLVVDASYFERGDGQGLLLLLREGGVSPAAVIFNAAEDDPDVSDGARSKLEAFAPVLEAELRR